MPEIVIHGRMFPYTIRKSNRARYVSLRVSATKGLQVIVPGRVAVKHLDIDTLLLSRADWIVKHTERLLAALAEQPERRYETGEHFPFLGQNKVLRVILNANSRRTTTLLDGETLIVRLHDGIAPNKQRDEVRRALEKWYHKQAQAYIVPRVAKLAEDFKFKYARISIKNQKTRWGSCSTQGNLNFNLRLMMTPPDAIDYIIIHELCHLREMNHSRRFWTLVKQYCPDYKLWVRWFKLNSAYLRF